MRRSQCSEIMQCVHRARAQTKVTMIGGAPPRSCLRCGAECEVTNVCHDQAAVGRGARRSINECQHDKSLLWRKIVTKPLVFELGDENFRLWNMKHNGYGKCCKFLEIFGVSLFFGARSKISLVFEQSPYLEPEAFSQNRNF